MKFIKYESRERIAYITLSRPEKKNALNAEVVAELIQAFNQAENDVSSKVIVLKAEGDVFCAGADLAYIQKLQGNTFEENHEDSILLKDLFLQIYQLNKVVIAQIQGHAIAGGGQVWQHFVIFHFLFPMQNLDTQKFALASSQLLYWSFC